MSGSKIQKVTTVQVMKFKRLPLFVDAIEVFLSNKKYGGGNWKPKTRKRAKYFLLLVVRALRVAGLDISPNMMGAELIEELVQFMCDEKMFKPSTRAGKISTLKVFFECLWKLRLIQTNPAEDLVAPKVPKPLPKPMTEEEVELLMTAPDISTAAGIKNRSILEVLYGSGLRMSECMQLRLRDLKSMGNSDAYVKVFGKGDKFRDVPLSFESVKWIKAHCFIADINKQDDYLWPGIFDGDHGAVGTFETVFKHFLKRVGLPDHYYPHMMRHSFATHLVAHGAPIEVVQALMGHDDPDSTMIYTLVGSVRAREVYRAAHPREAGHREG